MIKIAFFLIFLSWLVPNHYYPWSSAWNDFFAIFGLLFLFFGNLFKNKYYLMSRNIFLIISLMLLAVTGQIIFGKIKYFGDWVMVVFYLLIFWLSILKGAEIQEDKNLEKNDIVYLKIALIFGAIFSIGIALVQWTNSINLGIYVVDLPLGARPFGNLAQPNNLCTLIFMGICSLLWIHQEKLIGKYSLFFALGMLLFGMALTQSRTGVLQILLLMMMGLIFFEKNKFLLNRLEIFCICTLFFIFTLTTPFLNELLMLNNERKIEDYYKVGSRFSYWANMLDAVGRELNFGYGWMQASEAQQRVALDYPPIKEMFEHSHNIVLDIIIWNGIWIGGAIIFFCVRWAAFNIKSLRNSSLFFIFMGVFGVLIHSMLEYPLEYAYFLIPFGILIGFIDRFFIFDGHFLKIKSIYFKMIYGIFLVLFIFIIFEYSKIESYYKTMRFESANIGSNGLETKPPKIYILTQLKDYLDFVHSEAKIEMSKEDLMQMQKVSERFPFPPVLFRTALAYGINGYFKEAEIKLKLICNIHDNKRCEEAHEGWDVVKIKYPLLERVSF